MSADNGIYVLRTNAPPIKDGDCYINQHDKFEYRVAHCQAIENIEYSDLYLPLLFGNSTVHNTELEAIKKAVRLDDEIRKEYGFPTEYGVVRIQKDKVFPNMTPAAARVALDCYVGAKPLDVLDRELIG